MTNSHRITQCNRQQIVLNVAVNCNGTMNGQISCPADSSRVHQMRESNDAVAVGSGTYITDHPRLTPRAEYLGRPPRAIPRRVVFTARTPVEKLINSAENQSAPIGTRVGRIVESVDQHGPISFVQSGKPGGTEDNAGADLDLAPALDALADGGVQHLMVEGKRLVSTFLKQKHWNRATVYVPTHCVDEAMAAAHIALPELPNRPDRHFSVGDGTVLVFEPAARNRVASTTLVTNYGMVNWRVYEIDDEVVTAYVVGDPANCDAPLVRLHSGCLTGDCLGSCACDCGKQFHQAMQEISAAGCGVLIYLPSHEGRGIGLFAKCQAYAMKEKGYGTDEANMLVGYAAEARDYSSVLHVMGDLGISKCVLMTNNPEKVAALEAGNVRVIRQSLVTPVHENEIDYRRVKVTRMNHYPELLPSAQLMSKGA